MNLIFIQILFFYQFINLTSCKIDQFVMGRIDRAALELNKSPPTLQDYLKNKPAFDKKFEHLLKNALAETHKMTYLRFKTAGRSTAFVSRGK